MARIRAGDPSGLEHWSQIAAEFTRKGWYHSLELPDGRVIEGVLSLEQQRTRLRRFPLPDDLSGKRVLDIGAWDGWFSFEMERRGADVVAVDYIEQPGFLMARDLLGSKVDYQILDVSELSPSRLGHFDIVLFFGVLYHLKHPLLGLERICALTREMALIETFVTDDGTAADLDPSVPATMEFYETDELAGRLDNWVGPNTRCLLAFCRTAGFARVELGSVVEQRAHVTCYRHWAPEPPSPAEPKPVITDALNIRTHDRYLSTSRDDYLSIWFRSQATGLDLDKVLPEIGGYGVRPVYVQQLEPAVWQTNCMIPPGLEPGWHHVRVRTSQSHRSEPASIAIDQPPSLPSIERLKIIGATDGRTWDPNQIWLDGESWVSVWVAGLPENAQREDVKVQLGGATLYVSFVSPPDADGYHQVNARLPESTLPGTYPLTVSFGETSSPPFEIEARPRA